MKKKDTYTASDLTNIVIELISMIPEGMEREMHVQVKNEPSLHRLKQVKALSEALFKKKIRDKSLSLHIAALYRGAMIEKRAIADYKPFIKEMKMYLATTGLKPRPSQRWDISHIQYCYQDLVRLKTKTYDVLAFHEGLMCFDYFYAYPIYKSVDVIKTLEESMREIDRIIGICLDPKQQVFTHEELVANYGFPDECATWIDADNF